MSLMNTRRPASFMVLVTPNSLAALTELTKSPPALASASTCALDAWACSRNEEKSDAPNGTFTLPLTVPPPALMQLVAYRCREWPKDRKSVVRERVCKNG